MYHGDFSSTNGHCDEWQRQEKTFPTLYTPTAHILLLGWRARRRDSKYTSQTSSKYNDWNCRCHPLALYRYICKQPNGSDRCQSCHPESLLVLAAIPHHPLWPIRQSEQLLFLKTFVNPLSTLYSLLILHRAPSRRVACACARGLSSWWRMKSFAAKEILVGATRHGFRQRSLLPKDLDTSAWTSLTSPDEHTAH